MEKVLIIPCSLQCKPVGVAFSTQLRWSNSRVHWEKVYESWDIYLPKIERSSEN